MNLRAAVVVGLFGLILVGPASAADIVSVSGTPFSSVPIGGNGSVIATSWSSTGSFTGVSISALLTTEIFSGNPTGDSTGQAYLMKAIGPGATVADEVASNSFTVLSTDVTPTDITVFSGLALSPGSYSLVLDNTAGVRYYWDTAAPATVATGPGATYLADYYCNTSTPCIDLPFVPGSGFAEWSPDGPRTDRFEYTVTGDASQVPEPATFSVLGLGLGILGLLGAARRRYGTRT